MTSALERLQQQHGQADPSQLKEGSPISGSDTQDYPEPRTSVQTQVDDKPDATGLREFVSRPLSAAQIIKRLRTIYGMFGKEDDDVRDVIKQAAMLIKARPKQASECRHFIPDPMNPKGGVGGCEIEAGPQGQCQFPRVLVSCDEWSLKDG